MLVEIALLIFVFFLTYKFIFGLSRRPYRFPPGPVNYPIIGSVPALRAKTQFHETIYNLSKKYGPVMGLFLGPRTKCVAVNGYDAVKHVLSREDFAFRPDGILFRARAYNKRLGVLFSDGPLWKEQRRFTLRHLRDFGFGKKSMDGLIHEEIAVLMDNLNKRISSADNMQSEGILIKDLFPVSVINILWAIMAGVRYDHDNQSFQTLMHGVNEFFRNGTPTGGIMVLPILRFVPIVNRPFKKQLESVAVLQKFIHNSINEHKATYQEDNMRDFLDVFLKEMKAQENDENSTFTEEQLVVMCMDLFLAGTETTASSLGYFFLYLMQHPEEQEKMRQEIFRVVGRDRLPSLDDMPKLHYVQAVTWEVLRMANLLPFTIPHYTRTAVELFGYSVPRNTLILVNLYSVMMEDCWGDPHVFRPERFMKEGKCVKNERLIMFGHGPRVCLGEPLAKNTSFLFLTSLIQKFRFNLPTMHKEPNMDHLQGFTSSPRPYQVNVTPV